MNKKRNIIIFIIVVLVIILSLWITGIIPKKIAQITATNYLKNNFPKINLEFESIEWSSAFGGYVISFKDENDQTHGFIMNNKYFPISLGQGMVAFIEMYREKYENEEVSITVTSFDINSEKTTLLNNADELKKVLDSYDYKDEICKGIANYTLECSDGTKYNILVDCCGIVKDGKQAIISDEEMKQIEDFIKDNSNISQNVTNTVNNDSTVSNSNRKNNTASTEPYIPEGMQVSDENYSSDIKATDVKLNIDPQKIKIEVLENTISKESIEILITDTNKDNCWGAYFKIQKKINGEWKDLEYISEDLGWIEIAYTLDKNNQLKQKLNIENYYGKLNKGIYRAVKTIYDNGYIDIYSNEFEIK